MCIENVVNKSYKIAYDEHVGKLLSIPEKYLSEIKPNRQIPYSEIFQSYNSDIASCLNSYGDKLLSETMKALTSKGTVSIEEKEKIKNNLESYLNADLYLKRFDIFVNSIDRQLSRYGLTFDSSPNRIDIPKSLAEVHAKNTCRKIQAKIMNEMDVFLLGNKEVEDHAGFYRSINNLYNNHQLAFWLVGLVASIVA